MSPSSAFGPFRPGTGAIPPFLAGRETEQTLLRGWLSELSNGMAPGTQLIFYGPRGNGKTALLGWLKREAAAAGVETMILRPAEIPDEGRLRELLAPGSWWERLASGEVKIAGFSWKPGTTPSPPPGDILAVRARTNALVVIVDEAHTLDLEVGATLLNAAQEVGAELPCLLVLAGTPNLQSHLAAMSASFWNRAEQVRVGRLTREASAEALRRPLEDEGIPVREDALADLVRESQCYPFFVQLLGRAVWRAAARPGRGRRLVTREILAVARPEFEETKNDYYRHRYRELEKLRLLRVGAAVADAFRDRELLSDSLLDAAIRRGLGEAGPDRMDSTRETLSDLGFIWEPAGEPRWEPGIPSLMDYVRKFAPTPAAPNG